jgi:hypothetical protein
MNICNWCAVVGINKLINANKHPSFIKCRNVLEYLREY